MDRLAAMRTFVEIVEHGSLTAAAEALNRSQPAVVRSLAALESYLGCRLLRRTTRRMSLTPEGQDYLQRCRRILADVDEAEQALGQNSAAPHGQVKMTGPVEFGRLHLAPIITDFLANHEQLRVDLLLLDRNVDLVNEGMDLALRIGALADSSLVALPVAEIRRVTVASPALLQQTGIPQTPQELTHMPCIRQQSIPREQTSWRFRDGRQELAVSVDGRLGVNQVAAATSACVAGAGFGRFLSYQVQDLVTQGNLKIVLQKFEPKQQPVNLVYPGGKQMPARLRVLIDWLQHNLPPAMGIL